MLLKICQTHADGEEGASFARSSCSVCHTHEKVRTLTCLARKLSLASRLEHSNQTNNSRRWPSVPCFPCYENQTYWKLELAPFRCSVPHSPILGPRLEQMRPGGGCRRYDCEVPQLNWSGAFIYAQTLRRNCCFQCIALGRSLPTHQPPPRNLHGNGFPIHAEPTNNTNRTSMGQVLSGTYRGSDAC